ncbi:MAG: haloacid dehalogenase type II [Coleofasciculus sp. S288]|nr:haloacid dehalogenase type II [Coleofasciculus sp. S288]
MAIDFQQFEVLSFDCYGTLIDWEKGILRALKSIFSNHNIDISDNQLLVLFAEKEALQESGEYLKYREILKKVAQSIGEELNVELTDSELNALPDSIQFWEPFSDTVGALKTLKKRCKLTIISNVDNDLFAYTAKKLEVPFDWIITAEDVKSYKPSLRNFEVALQRMGISPNKLLHIAQSVYHDIVPAKSMGLTTVWVNRRKGKEGFGATAPASGIPELEVPDLKSLVSLI